MKEKGFVQIILVAGVIFLVLVCGAVFYISKTKSSRNLITPESPTSITNINSPSFPPNNKETSNQPALEKKISPTEEVVSRSKTFLVDVYINKNTPNQHELEEWITNTINSYINEKLQKAGINRKLKIDQILTYNKNIECPNYRNNCQLSLDKISVFVEAPATAYISTALPQKMQIRLIPQLGLTEDSQLQLTHEFGHIFGLPDYYIQSTGVDMDADGRPIEPFRGVYPVSNIKDIMLDPINLKDFSDFSKKLIDIVGNPPFTDVYKLWTKYTPEQVIIQVVDVNNQPMANANIEVYPQIVRFASVSDSFSTNIFRLSMTSTIKGQLDQNGEFPLGNYSEIFAPPSNANAQDAGYAAILHISYGNQQTFASINVDSLVNRYMQGEKTKTVFRTIFKNGEITRL